MLTEDVREQLRNVAESEEVWSLIIEWVPRPDPDFFIGADSKRERLTRLDEFYRREKRPVLERLIRYPHIRVEDFPGSPNAIVTATVRDWQTLAAVLADEPDVKLLPRVQFVTS